MRIYTLAITQMTLDGLIDGAGLGLCFGMIMGSPSDMMGGGALYGGFIGAILGVVLGIPCGLMVGFITHHHLYRLDDPQGYRYGLGRGIAVFVMVGAGIVFFSMFGILLGVIPTLIASVSARYAAKKFADQYAESK